MIPCDLCGGPGREVVAATEEVWRHVACEPCGLVWVDPLPAALATLNSEIYGGAARDEEERGAARGRRLAAELARLRAGLGPTSGSPRLLDVGCGDGALLAAAKAGGWDVAGVELEGDRAAEAAARGVGPVHHGPLETLDPALAPFDVVRLHHVVEHVPSPRALLAAATARLAPGGRLVVATPNGASLGARVAGAGWRHLGRPGNGHLVLLSPQALRGYARALGLEVEALATRGTRAWSLDRARPARRAWRVVEQALVPWARVTGRGGVLEATLRTNGDGRPARGR